MHADISGTRPIGARRAPLDQTWFPHILSRVVDLAPLDALLGLRATSRRLRDRIDGQLFEHVVLVTVAPRSPGAKCGVGFVSADAPGRLLPCIPSARQLPHSEGARTQCPTHVDSNKRLMAHIRILDSATAKVYDFPSLPLPLVRRCNPAAAGLPAHIIVQTLSLSPANEDDGVANAWDRFRQLAVTVTGTTPIGAPGPRNAGDGGMFVAHFAYNGAPRRGIVLDLRRRYTLHELVLVLPAVPDEAPVSEVVEGVRVTLMMALPSQGGGTRVTLVGVERFGPRHFGIVDAEDGLEAVRAALLAHCRLEPDDERLACIAYDEWAAGVGSEISAPPPHIPNTVVGATECPV